MTTHLVLTVLHVACTAVWFGGSISIPSRVRRGLSAGKNEASWMAPEIHRALGLSLVFGILTLITGLLLIFNLGGFKAVPKAIHLGLALTIIMLVLEAGVIRIAWNGIRQAIQAGADFATLKPQRMQLVMACGIEQLLWLIVLTLMVGRGLF